MAYQSRFSFVDYESSDYNNYQIEQDNLRAKFKSLEVEFNVGHTGSIAKIQIPQNEYSEQVALICSRLLKANMSTPENRNKALIQLEILYFLLGKDIRIRALEN